MLMAKIVSHHQKDLSYHMIYVPKAWHSVAPTRPILPMTAHFMNYRSPEFGKLTNFHVRTGYET